MSTSSVNATGLPDRRHFLSTVAGVGALSLPALPAFASTPGPIEVMFAEHLRLEEALDVAGERAMDAEELYEEPDRPRWSPFHEEGGYKTIMTEPGRGIVVLDDDPDNIAYLKDVIAREHEPDAEDSGWPNKHRAHKASATLAKIEAWQAEVRRRKDATGLTDAEAAEAEAKKAANACIAAIFAIEASSIRELAFQAAVLGIAWDEERAEHVLERLTVLAGVTPYTS